MTQRATAPQVSARTGIGVAELRRVIAEPLPSRWLRRPHASAETDGNDAAGTAVMLSPQSTPPLGTAPRAAAAGAVVGQRRGERRRRALPFERADAVSAAAGRAAEVRAAADAARHAVDSVGMREMLPAMPRRNRPGEPPVRAAPAAGGPPRHAAARRCAAIRPATAVEITRHSDDAPRSIAPEIHLEAAFETTHTSHIPRRAPGASCSSSRLRAGRGGKRAAA